jgi:tRNA (guanine-N7-)-methyltransferase
VRVADGPAAGAAPRREIRSFVRREGRMTDSQRRALEELWPRYGLEPPGSRLDLAAVFGRAAPAVLEIGFGDGANLLARAGAESEKNFLGVEVHRPGVGRVLNRAAAANLSNLRVACFDAVEVLRDWLAPASLAEIVIYFPDPWPKKRHHKRRLVQPAFVVLAASCLQIGGLLKLATDWAPYAEHMASTLAGEPSLRNTAGEGAARGGTVPRPGERPPTRFELRGERLGHAVADFIFERTR